MTTDTGVQHYFTSHRRTLPRSSLSLSQSLFSLWRTSKTKFTSTPPSEGPAFSNTDMDTAATATNGHHHDPPQSESQTQPLSFDTDIFRTYLLALLPPVIGALPSELDSLFDDEFDERVVRFAAESGGVVYIVKVRDEVEGLSFYLCLHIDIHGETTQMTEEHQHTRTTSPHI